MFDFNFLNRCMIIQNLEKGFIEMKQFLIYIVSQNVSIPRILLRSLKKWTQNGHKMDTLS